MALGVLCLVGFAAAWSQVRHASADGQAIEAAALKAATSGASADTQRGLLNSLRDQGQLETLWKRRRLGLLLAGLVLLIGGFWASGLRRLYDKMDWFVVEPSEGDERSRE